MHGMDVGSGRELAASMSRHADGFARARGEIEAALQRGGWAGRDAERWRGAWRADLSPRLTEADRWLRERSAELRRHADEQEKASDGGGSFPPGRLPVVRVLQDLGRDVAQWGYDRGQDLEDGWNAFTQAVGSRWEAGLAGLGRYADAQALHFRNKWNLLFNPSEVEPGQLLASWALTKATGFGLLLNAVIGRDAHFFDDGVPRVGEIRESAKSVVPTDFMSLTTGTMAAYDENGVIVTAIRNPGEPTRYLVSIPGTQAEIGSVVDGWSGNPNGRDWAANVHLMAGGTSSGKEAIEIAIGQAIAADRAAHPGESLAPPQVMLSGHSQGGIIAANLAADPAFRNVYDVTGIVTYGSPVQNAEVPASIPMLSLQNGSAPADGDLIPKLDLGGWGPGSQPNLTTVTLPSYGPVTDIRANHEQSGYIGNVSNALDDGTAQGRQITAWADQYGLDRYFVQDGGSSSASVVETGRRTS